MKKLILPLIALSLMLSCSLPATLTTLLQKLGLQSTPEAVTHDLMKLMEKDRVRVISTHGNLGVANLTGRTIDLQLYNNTNGVLEVSAPCALVFIPTDESASQMMMVQPLDFVFQAGQTITLKPFVLSIDSLKALPNTDKTYRVAGLAKGKELQLAQCLCKENLPAETETKDLLSLQLAAWMVADNSVITSLPEDINTWLKNLTGLPLAIPGLDTLMKNLAGDLAPNAKAWLDKCQIQLGN